MDAMRGDATLFTRNDEVEAQWRSATRSSQTWEATPGPLPQYPAGSQGPAEAQSLMLPGDDVADDLVDARRLRQPLGRRRAPRPARSRPRCARCSRSATPRTSRFVAGARAQHGLRRRQGVERRDRQPPAQRRPLPRRRARSCCAVEPQARRTSTRWRRSPATCTRRPDEFALLRETVIVDVGEQHLRALDTIVDPLVVTDLPTVLWSPHGHPEAVDALLHARAGGAARLGRRPRHQRRRSSARASCSTRPTSSTSRGCARRRGASASRRPSTRRTCAPTCATISAVTVRHHPESAAAALLLIGWLASRLGWQPRSSIPRNGRSRATAHGRARTSTLVPRARASAERPRPRGADARDRLGPPLRARPRARAACARTTATARATSASGPSSAPRAARPGSSARASARRCCATRPTGRRSTPPTRWRRRGVSSPSSAATWGSVAS